MHTKTFSIFIKPAVITVMVLLIVLSHWVTPVSSGSLHVLHIFLRKSFFIPIVLAAIWFELRGAIWTVSLVSMLYVPHIALQWSGRFSENANQAGEVASLWVFALLLGALIKTEKKAVREAADTRTGSLIALLGALDAREHETQRHSLRVQAFAMRIAQSFELNENDRIVLSHAALLHDIGKIGISDTILLKAGPLTDTEWSVMRRHPHIGYQLLQSVPFLSAAADTVYCHHEKYDGSGYPRGLSAETIPFPARIFTVADVFDALTSDRPYHTKISYEAARAVIAEDSGRHFDPAVVEVFLQVQPDEWHQIDKDIQAEPADGAPYESCFHFQGTN